MADDAEQAARPAGDEPQAETVLARMEQLATQWDSDRATYPVGLDRAAAGGSAAVLLCAQELRRALGEVRAAHVGQRDGGATGDDTAPAARDRLVSALLDGFETRPRSGIGWDALAEHVTDVLIRSGSVVISDEPELTTDEAIAALWDAREDQAAAPRAGADTCSAKCSEMHTFVWGECAAAVRPSDTDTDALRAVGDALAGAIENPSVGIYSEYVQAWRSATQTGGAEQ